MKIPRKFKLYGQTITVKFNKTLYKTTGTIGRANYFVNEITIQSGLDKSLEEQVFLHEATHIILFNVGDIDDQDEKLVNALSGMFYQLIQHIEG